MSAARGRRAASLAAALGAVLALSACGGSSSEHVKPVRLSGNGNGSVPSFTVVPGSELYWHTEGKHIRISNGSNVSVGGGNAENGAAIVPPGTYTDMHVTTSGNWWIEVR
jgi:hypothetical protein